MALLQGSVTVLLLEKRCSFQSVDREWIRAKTEATDEDRSCQFWNDEQEQPMRSLYDQPWLLTSDHKGHLRYNQFIRTNIPQMEWNLVFARKQIEFAAKIAPKISC